jgi:Winged helix DNA-binding domain
MPMLRWSSVLAWRLRRQHLTRRAPATRALDVVADIAGLHAQVASSAELTLWARVDDLEPGAVDRALWEDRTLVKTWAMRGTLHALPAKELGVWIAVQGELPPRFSRASWLKAFGVTLEEVEAILAAVPQALDGEPLTREELAVAVTRITGVEHLTDKLREGFGALLKPSAFRGDLCFAPSDGQRVRFTRPDRWLGELDHVETGAGADAVTRRYLSAYGPATRETYARWLGTSSAALAGRLLKRLGDEVAEVDVEGTKTWSLAADVEEIAEAEPEGVVRLLPAFDHYVVAAPRDAEAILPAALRDRVYRAQGWLSPVLLVDGRIEGTWRHEHSGSDLLVRVEPFAPVGPDVRAGAEDEARRLASFLGGTPRVEWAEP